MATVDQLPLRSQDRSVTLVHQFISKREFLRFQFQLTALSVCVVTNGRTLEGRNL